MNAPRLSERTAVVTGGTRGIGLAVVKRLQASGVAVLVTGTKDKADVPAGCDYYAVDFSDSTRTEEFASYLGQVKPLILVNNAGVTKAQAFTEIDNDEFERVHRVNLAAPRRLCTAVLAGMRAAAWGRIVNISSIWAVISRSGRGSYSSSKGGLDSMTRALAAEVAAEGILANCVAPGFIDTDLLRSATSAEDRQRLQASIPIGRLGRPEEIGAFVAWLCSDENTYISGQTLVIDGGFTLV